MKTHDLKTWPKYFDKLLDGSKQFEIRKNDRGFEVGDTLNLREWDPHAIREWSTGYRGEYTGRNMRVEVTYLTDNGEWLQPGYVVMGIRRLDSGLEEGGSGFPTSDEERAALSLEQVMDGVGAGDDHAFDELQRRLGLYEGFEVRVLAIPEGDAKVLAETLIAAGGWLLATSNMGNIGGAHKMAGHMTALQQLLRGEVDLVKKHREYLAEQADEEGGYECFGCDDRFLGVPAFTSPNGGTYCASCAEDWTAASDAPQDG